MVIGVRVRAQTVAAGLIMAAGAAAWVGSAYAQSRPGQGRGGSTMSQQQADRGKEPPPSPATRAYMDAGVAMHRDMAVRYQNDADKDFASVLEAHHKGAVEIAKVELQYGHDPEMRKLAEEVLASREREIALMRAWRAKQQ